MSWHRHAACRTHDPSVCEWCGVALSPRFGFGCCDECAERLRKEREDEQ